MLFMWGDPRTTTAEWRRLRQTILERDHHRCAVRGCNRPGVEVDHRVPHYRGGSDDPRNLQTMCAYHHRQKTIGEAIAARAAIRRLTKRPPEPHPGLRTERTT